MRPDCVTFRSRVEAYLGEALPREQRKEFRSHLRACPDCRAIALEQDSTLIFGLGVAAAAGSPRDRESELEAMAILENVRGAIAIRQAARRIAPEPVRGPGRRLAAGGALAACLVTAVFLNSSNSPSLMATARPSRAPQAAAPRSARSLAPPALPAPQPLSPASATIYEWNPGPGSETEPKIVWIVDRSFDI